MIFSHLQFVECLACLKFVLFCLKYQRLCRHVNILIISKGTKAKERGVKEQTLGGSVPAEKNISYTAALSTVGSRIHHSVPFTNTKGTRRDVQSGLIKILRQTEVWRRNGEQYIHIQELPLKGSKKLGKDREREGEISWK